MAAKATAKRLRWFVDASVRWTHYGAAAALLIMGADVTLNVILRYFFNSPFVFAPQLAAAALPVMAFLAVGAALRDKIHPAIDLVTKNLNKRLQNGILIFNLLFAIFVCTLYIYSFLRMARYAFQLGSKVDMLNINVGILHMLAVAGMVAVTLLFLAYLIMAIRNMAMGNCSGVAGEAPEPTVEREI